MKALIAVPFRTMLATALVIGAAGCGSDNEAAPEIDETLTPRVEVPTSRIPTGSGQSGQHGKDGKEGKDGKQDGSPEQQKEDGCKSDDCPSKCARPVVCDEKDAAGCKDSFPCGVIRSVDGAELIEVLGDLLSDERIQKGELEPKQCVCADQGNPEQSPEQQSPEQQAPQPKPEAKPEQSPGQKPGQGEQKPSQETGQPKPAS
jgi:hypothetical protein